MPSSSSPRPWLGRGLYALADADACERRGLELVETALALLGAGVPALQLRAKGRPARQVLAWAELVMKRHNADGTRFIVNDRADIAHAVGADGVHLGQDDLPPERVRAAYPHLRIGLSTHDEEQFGRALDSVELDYVAIGPVFPTASKLDPEPCIAPELLHTALDRTRKRGLSLVAIGGLSTDTLEHIAPHSDLLAAIGLLLPDEATSDPYGGIERRARELNERIRGLQA